MQRKIIRNIVRFSPITVATCLILVASVSATINRTIWSINNVDIPFAAKYIIELSTEEKTGWIGELAGRDNYIEISITGASFDLDQDDKSHLIRESQDVITIEGKGGKKRFGSMHGGIDDMHERHQVILSCRYDYSFLSINGPSGIF